MKPLGDKLLVQVDKAEERTKSGLFVTEEWKTLPPFATVKAIGPYVTQVRVGDRIVFNRYAAVALEYQDRLILERDILATIEPETDDAESS